MEEKSPNPGAEKKDSPPYLSVCHLEYVIHDKVVAEEDVAAHCANIPMIRNKSAGELQQLICEEL